MDAAWGAPPPIPPIDPLLSSSNGLGLNFGAPTPAQTIPLADGTTLPWPDLNLDFLQFNFANLQPGPASTSVPLSGDAFLGLPTMSPEVFNSLSTECGVRLPSAIPNWLQRFDEVLATTPKDTFAVGLPHATISPAQGIQAGPSREGNTVSYGPPVPESPAQEKQAGPSRAGEELMNASTSRQAVFPPPAWSPASSHSPALMQSPSSLSNTSPSPYNSASPSPAGLSNALPLPPWGAIPTAPSDALEEELGAQRPGGSGGTDAARKRLERVMASAPKYKRQPAAFKVMMENPAAAREVMERVQVLAELELDMSSPSVKQRRRLITTAYGIFMGIARPELEPEMHWYRPIVKRYAEQFLYAKVLTTKGTKGEDRVRSRTLWQWFEILRWCIQMFTWDGDARLVGLRLLVQEGLLSRLEDVCLWIVREHKLRRHAGEMVYIGQPEFCLLVETQMKMTEVEGRLVGLQTLAAMTVQFLLGLRISTLAASNDEYLALGYVCTLYLLTSVAPSCIVHPFSLILTPMEAIPVLSRIITSIASNSRRGSVISFGASTDALQFMLNSAFEIYKRSRSQFAIRLHCENFKNGYGVEATYKIFEMEPCKFPQNTMFSPIAIVAYFFARGDLEFSTWEELLDSPASRLTLKNPSRPFLLKLRRGGHGFVEPDTPTNAMLVNAAYKRVMLAAGIPGSSHAFRHNVGIESNRIHGSATASMLLVHSEDNTVASRHYSRNTADFDMTALMSGEHPNAQDPDYIEKRTRALYTSSYVRAGIRRVHGMIGAAPTPNKIDIASLTLPAGLSLPQKRKNLVVLTPDEEMAVKNDARWVTSFASVKSTWDGICKYMPQLRAEKINDPNTFTRELKKAKAVAPDGLEPNAWQDLLKTCKTQWDAHLKAAKASRQNIKQRKCREQSKALEHEPSEVEFTHEEHSALVASADDTSQFLVHAAARYGSTSTSSAFTAASHPSQASSIEPFSVSDTGMPIGDETSLGHGNHPSMRSKKRKAPEDPNPEEDLDVDLGAFDETGEVNTLNCTAEQMAEWFFRSLVEPAIRQAKGKGPTRQETDKYHCDMCKVLTPDVKDNWKSPAKLLRHFEQKHLKFEDALNDYLHMHQVPNRNQCPFCLDLWGRKSQCINHLEKIHTDAYQRILQGEYALEDIRLARAEEGEINSERRERWDALIDAAERYDDALARARNYAKVYISQTET